jgi:hypothetical protein
MNLKFIHIFYFINSYFEMEIFNFNFEFFFQYEN